MEIPDVHKDTLKSILHLHYLDVMEYPSEYAGSPKELVVVLAEGQKLCGLLGVDWKALLAEAQQAQANSYDTQKEEGKK